MTPPNCNEVLNYYTFMDSSWLLLLKFSCLLQVFCLTQTARSRPRMNNAKTSKERFFKCIISCRNRSSQSLLQFLLER